MPRSAGSSGGGGLCATESPPHSEAADHADADGEPGDEATSPDRAKDRARAPFRPPRREGAASAGRSSGAVAEAPLDVSKGFGADPGRKVSRFFQRTAPAAGLSLHMWSASSYTACLAMNNAVRRPPAYSVDCLLGGIGVNCSSVCQQC